MSSAKTSRPSGLALRCRFPPHTNCSQIYHLDRDLSSVEGAREVISMISSRRMVTRLALGLNNLGDDGTIVLFKYLGSDLGRKYNIAEISLNSNGIGDQGLLAIAEYLDNNVTLKELFLQNNNFAGNSQVIAALSSAINSSVLETLSLTTNRSLSDSFIEQFLPKLDSPNLGEIHLSAMGLSPRSTQPIIDYISSPRCRLHTFKCNGNGLGYRSVRRIIRALERSNFGLLRVELYSNQYINSEQTSDVSESETTAAEENEDEWGAMGLEAWKEGEKLLKRVLLRNDHLKSETQTEALRLLRFARAMLLQPIRKLNQTVYNAPPKGHPNDSYADICAPLSFPNVSHPTSSIVSVFPFVRLPIELQLHIISFLAPTLSSGQCVRIYNYASLQSTLPSFLRLPDRGIPGCSPGVLGKSQGKNGGGCDHRKCIVSGSTVVCHKEEERAKWLAKVGCCAFEPEGDCDGRMFAWF